MGTDIQGIGYLATPASGSGPGIIVLQEWWGLVPHIKNLADRFAEAGYVAIAPDLYDGTQTTSPDEAGRLLMALNIDQTAQKLLKTVEYLLNHDAVTSDTIGVVGFCMGGQLALLAGTLSPNIGAVVDFYGIHPNVKPDFSKLQGPVLGFFGEQDDLVTSEAVSQLEAAIRAADRTLETHIYPNSGHAFFNDTRPEAYNPTAATDAWQKTLAFFSQNLATA
ncbi:MULTISPECIES: dienelactone hydrolase family protein [unclassified Leptolyngbya]|uniref:dienelactone hydrolase family protein n=1 Tax=unclassified Leptolyngbya TaxID=2650499 RepID=UPI001689131F|nr:MULTISPECIES: dienelactone hydrolase family protein [unclassified Leptolyngbya]MBD1911193.1 dienelactone hydrolase family protein [Leptolyngbya sp. FACHB-8]MBD2155440.1 dienelactone hydrolase family protein [Leptolyngbya sp. FACHB-16]